MGSFPVTCLLGDGRSWHEVWVSFLIAGQSLSSPPGCLWSSITYLGWNPSDRDSASRALGANRPYTRFTRSCLGGLCSPVWAGSPSPLRVSTQCSASWPDGSTRLGLEPSVTTTTTRFSRVCPAC